MVYGIKMQNVVKDAKGVKELDGKRIWQIVESTELQRLIDIW